MNKQTAELIFALKGRLKNIYPTKWDGNYIEIVKAIIHKNHGEDLDSPYVIYKDWIVSYVKEAVLDYSKTLETTTAFFMDYFDARKSYDNCNYIDDIYCWCVALALTQVKDKDGNYINGFSEKLLENVLKENLKDLASYLNSDEV